MLISQKIRDLAPEMDSLRLGMGWSEKELDMTQIIIPKIRNYHSIHD